jgi:anti-anti-sigma regulatory factor
VAPVGRPGRGAARADPGPGRAARPHHPDHARHGRVGPRQAPPAAGRRPGGPPRRAARLVRDHARRPAHRDQHRRPADRPGHIAPDASEQDARAAMEQAAQVGNRSHTPDLLAAITRPTSPARPATGNGDRERRAEHLGMGGLLILDLSRVRTCDQAGLAVLIGIQRRASSTASSCAWPAPGPPVAKLLCLTGLDRSLHLSRSARCARRGTARTREGGLSPAGSGRLGKGLPRRGPRSAGVSRVGPRVSRGRLGVGQGEGTRNRA